MIGLWIYLGIGVLCGIACLVLHAYVSFQAWKLSRTTEAKLGKHVDVHLMDQFSILELTVVILLWPAVAGGVVARIAMMRIKKRGG